MSHMNNIGNAADLFAWVFLENRCVVLSTMYGRVIEFFSKII